MAQEIMRKKVIIDCDVGVDDALALIFAFHSSELEVMAVTGVDGNVPLGQVFENIQKILYLIQPRPKPLIAQGADRPLTGKSVYAHSVHGKDGLGGARIDRKGKERWWQIYPGPAQELITKMALQHPHQLTLVATGPLTNLALGLQEDPEGMRKLKEVVIMGGAVRTKGNITSYAEFNVFVDPLAAKMVFDSGLPISLVPLDVTHQVFLTPPVIEERLIPIKNPFSQFLIEAIGYDPTTHRFSRGSERVYLHDPLAIGAVIDPSLVKKESLSLSVQTQEGKHYGRVSEVNDGPKIEVCLAVDAEKFLDLFISRLR
ncbi:MAG: nucleoside hydrolase [Thermodesulfobacteriota bacterium]